MLIKKHNYHGKDYWKIYYIDHKNQVTKSTKSSVHESHAKKSYNSVTEFVNEVDKLKDKTPAKILYHNEKIVKSEGDPSLIEECEKIAYNDRPNGFNGIKNFPKLLLKLMLNHEYIYDYLTYWTLAAEIFPERIVDTPYVNFGAASGAIAALISKGQDLRSKHPYSM